MSNTAAVEEEIEEARLPSPHLDFTGCIRSILDGDKSFPSPSTEVPSVPIDVSDMEVNTSNQGNNNDSLVQNVPKAEEIVEEDNGNPGNKTKSTDDDQVVETFFGLDIDNQAQVLINYKKSIDQLFAQNRELTGVLEAVNEDQTDSQKSIPGEYRSK